MRFKHGLIIGLIFGAMFGVGMAQAAETQQVTATQYRDAQFLTCFAAVPESTVKKSPDAAVAKCLAKAEKKTTAWQERKAKQTAKAEAKKAKAMAKCNTDTECEAADGKEI